MKLIVNPHKLEIDKSEAVNEQEINISKCEFEFSEEITSDFVKEAYFTFKGNTYKQIIVNDACDFPAEVLTEKGQVEIGVVAYLVEDETEIKRFNPSPVYFETWKGSLKADAENSEPITPSEMEQYEQALNDGLLEVQNVDIDAVKSGGVSTITITNRNGTEKQVQVLDGAQGEQGPQGPAGKDGTDGKDGKDGENGQDGVSPTVQTIQDASGADIIITDGNGTHTARVNNGANGQDGQNGQNGTDGFSPTATVTQSGNNTTISITDKNGTTTATITVPQVDTSTLVKVVNVKDYNSTQNAFSFDNLETGIYILYASAFTTFYMKTYSSDNSNTAIDNFYENQFDVLIYKSKIPTPKANIYNFAYWYKNVGTPTVKRATISYYGSYGGLSNETFNYLTTSDAKTVSGKLTFSTLPESSVVPTSNDQLVNKKYVDDSITTAITTTLGGSY